MPLNPWLWSPHHPATCWSQQAELEAQIAEREAARRVAEAADRAREAAEEARRAARPPPWDPAARAARPGGGGEPLKDSAGNAVADLRAVKSGLMLSSSGGAGVCASGSELRSTGPLMLAAEGSSSGWAMGGARAAAVAATATADFGAVAPNAWASAGGVQQQLVAQASEGPRGAAAGITGRPFMAAITELRPGPSEQQRAAAATARQQLLADLDEQVNGCA